MALDSGWHTLPPSFTALHPHILYLEDSEGHLSLSVMLLSICRDPPPILIPQLGPSAAFSWVFSPCLAHSYPQGQFLSTELTRV